MLSEVKSDNTKIWGMSVIETIRYWQKKPPAFGLVATTNALKLDGVEVKD